MSTCVAHVKALFVMAVVCSQPATTLGAAPTISCFVGYSAQISALPSTKNSASAIVWFLPLAKSVLGMNKAPKLQKGFARCGEEKMTVNLTVPKAGVVTLTVSALAWRGVLASGWHLILLSYTTDT